MANIAEMTMEEYKKWMRDNRSGLVQPEIPNTTNFELKGHILSILKYIPFYRKVHKDAYRHIDKVNDITNYFNVPNVPPEMVLFGKLLVNFKGEEKDCLKALPCGSVTTWEKLRQEFIQQFNRPSKVSKLKTNISNFE